MREFLFSYDDITLIPKCSELESRDNADTSVEFLDRKFGLPVIPANMQDVIGLDNAKWLIHHDYFYIMHRFGDIKNYRVGEGYESISVGVKDKDKAYLDNFGDDMPDVVTVDVAHGYHKNVKEMINFIRKLKIIPHIIAGNVATADGYKFLCDLGVDAVKVGIGGGSICTTKFQTGFHIPTAYSVWECAQTGYNIPIIADGGLKHYGDIAKALVLGATMVMSGGWFASCIDSPARIQNGKKIYRGSTSYEAKGNWNHVEGKTLELEEGITYEQRLYRIKKSLQSSISYGGGKDLSCFNSVKWYICH